MHDLGGQQGPGAQGLCRAQGSGTAHPDLDARGIAVKSQQVSPLLGAGAVPHNGLQLLLCRPHRRLRRAAGSTQRPILAVLVWRSGCGAAL